MSRTWLLLMSMALLAVLHARAAAQPFNVRAWYAKGQVFVVWEMAAAPATPTSTVEIYASAGPQPDTSFMTMVGKLFFTEYTGRRLWSLAPGSTITVPTPGGQYTLAANEGVFAYTPHQAGGLFFAVVDTGSTTVVAANSAATAFAYDPVNDPIRPHPQFGGFTPGGHPYTAYIVWSDGRADHTDRRPDYPVTGNALRNGVPHVFTVTFPLTPPPPGPLSCLLALHGGGGEYELFRPGFPARANMSLDLSDGIVITPDDSIFANVQGSLEGSTTGWFGYHTQFDPFFSGPRTDPPAGSLIVNYTQRRIIWMLEFFLRPSSPIDVDEKRVAVVGHSAGGRGTSMISRLRPDLFCAAVIYTPASNLGMEPAAGQANYLRGTWDQNLATNLVTPQLGVLGVTDVFEMDTRLSPDERDIPLTRVFYGKRDEEGAAAWNAEQRAVLDGLNDTRLGYMIFWDEREHGVEKWDDETSDATDSHPGPWPDIGQWIAPDRTYRASGRALVANYSTAISYPGFFNSDHYPMLSGRQPDPGLGDPDLGMPFGTWSGYFEWENAGIIDAVDRWECTVFATGPGAPSPIDVCPVAEITADVAPRRTIRFRPPAGASMNWTVTDVPSGTVLQSGRVQAEAEGVVVVPGVVVKTGPSKVRISIVRACGTADFDGDGDTGTDADIEAFFACLGGNCCGTCGTADFDGDGDTGTDADIEAFFTVLGGGVC